MDAGSSSVIRLGVLVAVVAASGSACQDVVPSRGSSAHIAAVTAKVDGAFVARNTDGTTDWPTHGLDYAETRFSRLDQITAANVKDIGLLWSYDLESTRGVEATPLVVEHRACDRRADGNANLDVRSRSAARGRL